MTAWRWPLTPYLQLVIASPSRAAQSKTRPRTRACTFVHSHQGTSEPAGHLGADEQPQTTAPTPWALCLRPSPAAQAPRTTEETLLTSGSWPRATAMRPARSATTGRSRSTGQAPTTAAKDLDIDVRVNSRDQSVFVRFNNGAAKFRPTSKQRSWPTAPSMHCSKSRSTPTPQPSPAAHAARKQTSRLQSRPWHAAPTHQGQHWATA